MSFAGCTPGGLSIGPVTAVRTQLRVRRAGPEDVAALAVLMRRVERSQHAHLSRPAALEVHLHRRCTAWYLLGRLGAGDQLFMAERGGRAVGMTAAQITAGPRHARLHLHSTTVDRLDVLPEAEEVHAALVHSALRVGDRAGAQLVSADCLQDDESMQGRLRHLGLQPVGSPAPSTTLPGARVVHWRGRLDEALRRTEGR